MSKRGLRRIGQLAAVVTFAAAVGVAVAGPASGQDFSESSLYVKPAGSTHFTYLTSAVFEGVAPGSSTTFQIKVVNTGAITAQFQLSVPADVFALEDLVPASAVLSVNGRAVPSNTYVTPVLAPGEAQLVSLKVSVPRLTLGSGSYLLELDTGVPGNNGSGEEQFMGVTVAQSSGASAADVFVKAGGQPFVGGWDTGTDPRNNGLLPFETLPVMANPSTANATVRLQNDSVTPGRIALQAADISFFDGVTPADGSWPIAFFDGFKNVTAAVRAGTYTTPTLAPGAHRDLRLSVKNVSNPAFPAAFVYLTTSGQGQSMVTAAVATDAV